MLKEEEEEEQHHVAVRCEIRQCLALIAHSGVCVCVCFGACGVCLWDDSRLLPPFKPLLRNNKMGEFGGSTPCDLEVVT